MDKELDGISCLLLDLDGTLLGVRSEVFEKGYISHVAKKFIDDIQPDPFIMALWQGTEAMYRSNDTDNFVIEAFFKEFTKITEIDRQTTFERFQEFYKNDYGKLQQFCDYLPVAKKLVDKAKNKGYKVLCATNPVFPEIATRQRINWAGLDYEDFFHVSHAENSYFCKPNPQYYISLLKKVGVSHEKALMVGNDYYFDMGASAVGIKTWMVDQYQDGQEHKGKFNIDYEGSLENLYELI